MASIVRHTTVIRDGLHNAFTDLAQWQGCYWVTYRKGSAHQSMDGRITISVSTDRARFCEVAEVKVPGDCRDPKFVVMSEDKVALYFASWIGGGPKRQLQQYVTFSHDGFNWEEPVPILDRHWWLWRIVPYDGRYYGACFTYIGRNNDSRWFFSADFLVSDDLLKWESLGQIGDAQINEAGFHFQPDGEVWMIARGAKRLGHSMFCSARPPYKEWTITNLETMIHAPVTLEHEGKLYVAGRRNAGLEGDATYPFAETSERPILDGVASLGVWQVERGRVEPVLRIPAAGDCSYPGLIRDDAGRICLTYYSQHAYYLGVVPTPMMHDPHYGKDQGGSDAGGKVEMPVTQTSHSLQVPFKLETPSDVFFAELELP